MATFLDRLLGTPGDTLNDQIIANDMLLGAKGAATAYFLAAIESANPEIRRLFFDHATQLVQSHGALTEMALERGWYQAYGSPEDQLLDWYEASRELVHPAESH